MAVSFGKKPEGAASSPTSNKAPTSAKKSTGSKPSGGVSFIKTGAEAAKKLQEAEAAAEVQKEQMGKLWRFRIGKGQFGQDFRVTFLEGDMGSNGMLAIPQWEEYTLYFGGKWQQFIALNESDGPDPIRESGEKPDLVFGFTIIDHSEYEAKDGKVYKDRRKLFIAKPKTYKQLLKIATKRGGLVGCTFDISRTDDKSPAVGDMIEFVEKRPLSAIIKQYGEEAVPVNWEEELIYRDRETLLKMGFGGGAVFGSEKNGGGDGTNYDKEL